MCTMVLEVRYTEGPYYLLVKVGNILGLFAVSNQSLMMSSTMLM